MYPFPLLPMFIAMSAHYLDMFARRKKLIFIKFIASSRSFDIHSVSRLQHSAVLYVLKLPRH